MSQVSIRDQIKKLVQLQTLDYDIYNFKKDLKDKPDFIEQLKTKFEDKKGNLKQLEDKLKTLLLDRKSKEGDLLAKEGEIAKANTQLFSLKTNKEYQAKLLEIEHMKADKSMIEEKILLLFDEIDSINAQIEKEKKIVTEEEKKLLAQKKEVDDSIKDIQERMSKLESERRLISPEVNPAYLSRYERILENKGGIALVPVKGHVCGGCFMNIPEQSINEIKMHDHFVFCEMCARILFLEDDL